MARLAQCPDGDMGLSTAEVIRRNRMTDSIVDWVGSVWRRIEALRMLMVLTPD
jgi:hypothetical protein